MSMSRVLHVCVMLVNLDEGSLPPSRVLAVRGPASPLTRVFVEAGQLTEAPVAGGAPVRLLASVCPQVHRQVALLHEAAPAVRAAERLLARVAADVAHQRGPPAEALAADGAAVRPLARVDPHVRPQVPAQGEALTADVAAERRFSVDAEVELQALRQLQMFPAQAAVPHMCRGVREEVTDPLEGLATNLTAERGGWRLLRQIGAAPHARARSLCFLRLLRPPQSGLLPPVVSAVFSLRGLSEESAAARCFKVTAWLRRSAVATPSFTFDLSGRGAGIRPSVHAVQLDAQDLLVRTRFDPGGLL